MKWLGKWITKQIRNSQEEVSSDIYQTQVNPGFVTNPISDNGWTENLNIGITTANGGKIVTFRRYDPKTDRSDNRIYIIPEDMDFGHELGKLITLESIRG